MCFGSGEKTKKRQKFARPAAAGRTFMNRVHVVNVRC